METGCRGIVLCIQFSGSPLREPAGETIKNNNSTWQHKGMEAEGIDSSALQRVCCLSSCQRPTATLRVVNAIAIPLFEESLSTLLLMQGDDKCLSRRAVAGFHLENLRAFPGYSDHGSSADGQFQVGLTRLAVYFWRQWHWRKTKL